MSKVFGSRLKQLRIERNEKQEQLGKLLVLTISTISGYETGFREPNFDVLCKIAKHYNVTTDYLLGISDIRNYNEENKFDGKMIKAIKIYTMLENEFK